VQFSPFFLLFHAQVIVTFIVNIIIIITFTQHITWFMRVFAKSFSADKLLLLLADASFT
jgi:hypothetical protein